MRKPVAVHPRRRQAGVTLVEIMVAVVLLAIGLLGLAGLQLRGMQVNQGSAMRTQAAIMAEDLADRMRADVQAANPGNPNAGFYGAFTPANQATAAPQAMQDWLANFGNALPAGVAAATVPCGGNVLPCVQVSLPGGTANPPVPVRIDIYWNDQRAAKGADPNAAPTTSVGQYTMVAYL
jgi:type IV pilus assembly protein PilV